MSYAVFDNQAGSATLTLKERSSLAFPDRVGAGSATALNHPFRLVLPFFRT